MGSKAKVVMEMVRYGTGSSPADLISEYLLGLAMKREALMPHKEWVAEYDRS